MKQGWPETAREFVTIVFGPNRKLQGAAMKQLCSFLGRRVTSTYVVVSLLTVLASAQPSHEPAAESFLRLDGSRITVAEIERRIPELMASVWLPGVSVIVVRDGAIAYRQSFGVRDARGAEPITPETSFTGLSFSKTITAFLVMRLVEAGVFDLDRALHTYLSKPVPEYDFYTDLRGDKRYERITARMVLSHTTGWPNWRWFTEERKLRFLFDPGKRHSYSGEGFAYLQLVLEELTGKSFAELAQREVFEPLELSHSSMIWRPTFERNYAEDHDLIGRPLQRERWDEASAAGSLQTTIGDYARFLIAVLHAQGISPETRDEMIRPQVPIRHERMFGPRATESTERHRETGLAWTLGWGTIDTPYGRALFHTGNDRGSANYAIAFPEARSAVVLMGNSNRLEGIAEDLIGLLIADRSSPFDFLGYDRWDGPRQTWFRTLADGGLAAGRAYWESLGAKREASQLNDEEAFEYGSQVVETFGSAADVIALQRWRRALFPKSVEAVKGLVRAYHNNQQAVKAVQILDELLPDFEMAEELAWFHDWIRTLAQPHPIPLARLKSFAGDYETRHVQLRDGHLYYGRGNTDPADYYLLTPMDDDTFVLEGLDFFRLRFELDESGRSVRVIGLYEGGETDSNERTHDPD